MATKKKAVKAAPPEVVVIDAQPLEAWATEAIGVVKTYRSGAYSSAARTALDDILVRLRVLISEGGSK